MLNGLGTAFTLNDLEDLDYILEKLTYCAKKSDFMSVNFAYADGTAYRNRWISGRCVRLLVF